LYAHAVTRLFGVVRLVRLPSVSYPYVMAWLLSSVFVAGVPSVL
jgi:hypothetical protein